MTELRPEFNSPKSKEQNCEGLIEIQAEAFKPDLAKEPLDRNETAVLVADIGAIAWTSPQLCTLVRYRCGLALAVRSCSCVLSYISKSVPS